MEPLLISKVYKNPGDIFLGIMQRPKMSTTKANFAYQWKTDTKIRAKVFGTLYQSRRLQENRRVR